MKIEIPGKEFYFVRHGETDHNFADLKSEQPSNMALNSKGVRQTYALKPILQHIPFCTVCISPLKRAQETAKILTSDWQVDLHIIDDFVECSMQTWNTMIQCKENASSLPDDVQRFIQQIQKGLLRMLSFSPPILLVAHGGCYWALCHLLCIKQAVRIIDNCIPIRFFSDAEGQWAINCILSETQ